MQKRNSLLTLGLIGAGVYLLAKSLNVSASNGGDGSGSTMTTNKPTIVPEGLVYDDKSGTPTLYQVPPQVQNQPAWMKSASELQATASKLGRDPVANEIIAQWRAYPDLSWEAQKTVALAASPSALQFESQLKAEMANHQVIVKQSPAVKLSGSDVNTLNKISTQGGLAAAFANQVKGAGAMTAMDKQIAKNYAAKLGK